MRSNEERLHALHERAAELEKNRRNRKVLLAEAAAAAVCMIFIALLSVHIAGTAGSYAGGNAGPAMQAGIFSGSVVLGYIVLGVAAFLLGAAVTIFFYCLKKWQDEKNRKKP